MRQAAADALCGTDEDVVTFLRTGWDTAERRETRDGVTDLSTNSPYASVRTAAATALAGDDRTVSDFYTTGQYTAGAVDMEVEASKLVNAGGPEVQAAAKVALAGHAAALHDFIAVGQYMADRKDQLAATHVAQVTGLIAQADAISATARSNAWPSSQAAFAANGAADKAQDAANRAGDSAREASGYARDADASADQAQLSGPLRLHLVGVQGHALPGGAEHFACVPMAARRAPCTLRRDGMRSQRSRQRNGVAPELEPNSCPGHGDQDRSPSLCRPS
ncbi:hypothetical protein OG223_22520 [Streptomyces sp. NBC_01478]|uniref:ALF repeat-containing protein n=1 Tax=Streptomyces sp. NBC_01478 TaxID=2903882 RepID=UPI002E35D287|nr:ALF repeat-containing protein [Streptomyces sp. NBC_01478]